MWCSPSELRTHRGHRQSRRWRCAILALAFGVAACGGTSTTAGTGDIPPSTDPLFVNVHAVAFDSLDAMAEAGTLIMVGTVVAVDEGRFFPAPASEDFQGTQELAVAIRVDEVWKGDAEPGEVITIRWAGYDILADGTPGPQAIVNGQPPPTVGDRNLWFLAHDSSGYGLVAFEGRLTIGEDGRLRLPAPVGSGAARNVGSMTVAEARRAVSGGS